MTISQNLSMLLFSLSTFVVAIVANKKFTFDDVDANITKFIIFGSFLTTIYWTHQHLIDIGVIK